MITKETVDYVAKLARIQITEQEKDFLSSQLSKILDYIDTLNELNLDNIQPFRGSHLVQNILREDKVENFPFKEEILKNAPLREENYFKIPKVIE